MHEQFRFHIEKKVPITIEEFEHALTFFTARTLTHKEFLLREGEVCLYHAFVESGGARVFSVDDKGREHISIFALEGNWISDLYSFCSGLPSRFYIDAIEDSSLLLIKKEASEKLCDEIPKFDRFFRVLYQRSIANLAYKLDDSSRLSAKEKYQQLLESQPDIVHRVPQYQLASYLGITPESLSRIRKGG